ncbi:MAG: ArsR/SmtB family transcription factor [Vicinamibacterales bacterium]
MRPLSDAHTRRIAARAQALADVTRVRIVELFARAELPVGRIAAALSREPSTVSKDLQVLFREELVTRRRRASTVIYALADPVLIDWCRYLAGSRAKGTTPP